MFTKSFKNSRLRKVQACIGTLRVLGTDVLLRMQYCGEVELHECNGATVRYAYFASFLRAWQVVELEFRAGTLAPLETLHASL